MKLSLEKQMLENKFNELSITMQQAEKALDKARTKKNIMRKRPEVADLVKAVEMLDVQVDGIRAYIKALPSSVQ